MDITLWSIFFGLTLQRTLYGSSYSIHISLYGSCITISQLPFPHLISFHLLRNPPPESLSCLIFFYLTPTHTLLTLGRRRRREPECPESERRYPKENRKLGVTLKTNCNKVWLCHESVEIGPGRWDYLLRSAPTYRKGFVTSEKVR